MRVIGGSARGRRLRAGGGPGVRPTSDRVREAVFDLIGPAGPGERVLDLFAGSGALGIEALSRGARLAVFVERDRRALNLTRANLARCGFADRARLRQADARRFLERPCAEAPFDLVLADPPYRRGWARLCLEGLAQPGWLQPNGRVFIEIEAELALDQAFGPLQPGRRKRYGNTAVLEFQRPADG